MNLDDFKNAWQEQQQTDTSAIDKIATRVRKRTVAFERKGLLRDVIEWLAVASVIPLFARDVFRFDSWVVKAGCLIVIAACIQVAIVLALTRFRRRPRVDQTLMQYTRTELRRVLEQVWLLDHVASWYAGPILLGCFVISWGRDPWWVAIICSVIFSIFGAFVLWINRRGVKKLRPLRDELRQTLVTLEEDKTKDSPEQLTFVEPQFTGLEKMRKINIAIMAIVVIASVFWSAYRMLPAGELSVDEAEQLAAPLVDAERVNGLSVGIIDGSRRLTFHLGETQAGQGPPNDQTLYEIGSINQVLTGTLLGMEADQEDGFLRRPADVPDIGVELPQYEGQAITWLDMATHRSGLPRLPTNLGDGASINPDANYDSAKAIEFLSRYELPRRPGTDYEFSKFAYSWLGHLLVKRAGALSYDQLLENRITGPLGMDDTVVTLSPSQRKRIATPHATFGVETSTSEFADLPGAAGIRSTTADMMKFMTALLDPPNELLDGRLGRGIDLAWKEHQSGDSKSFAMGLGWQIARDGETRWHHGQTGGFHTAMFVNRGLNVGVVVLANTADAEEVDALAAQLIQRLAGSRVQPRKLSKEIDVDRETMKRLEGRYQLAPTFIFDVKVVDDRLMVGITNQATHQVYASRKNRWFYKVVEAELDFDLATGPAKSLQLIQNGRRQTAKRIP